VDHHVVVNELGGPRRVRHDAADGAGDEINVLRSIGAEPIVDRRLIAEIELLARRGENVLEAKLLETANDRRANEAPVTGDEDS
jgi:hypothetical protein